MGLFVKICGIATADDAAAVAEMRPEALGFVFWGGSKRFVRAEEVGAWGRDLPAGLLKVGVFVDASVDEVQRVVETAGLDVAQLHGAERPEDFAGRPFRLWRSLSLRSGEDVEPSGGRAPELQRVACCSSAALSAEAGWRVDAFLVDTYSPLSPGGTGKVGDWTVARSFVERCPVPVLLAGGLSPANVKAAVVAVQPWGVDVSSGVELHPGKKDLVKVREFIERCRKE